MSKPTPAFLLLQERLGRPLDKRVMKARSDGKSWDQIARELDQDTGVPITSETLRGWFYELDQIRIAKTRGTVTDAVAS